MRKPALLLVPALLTAILLFGGAPCRGEEAPAKTWGWRGNWTGLYPDADAPTEWGRIAKGVVAGTTCQAARPADGAPKSGQGLARGMIRDWLVIGPLPVADNLADFDKEQIPGEKDLRPAEGDKVGDLTWKRQKLKIKPDMEARIWCTRHSTAPKHLTRRPPQTRITTVCPMPGRRRTAWTRRAPVTAQPSRRMDTPTSRTT